MARQLVTRSPASFDPEKYHDEYREEVLALIERKAAGEEIVAPAAPEEPAKVLDLMAALEASLARTGAKQTPSATGNQEAGAKKAAAKKPAAKQAAAKKVGARPNAPASRPDADRAGYEAWGMATGAGRRRGKRRAPNDGHLDADVVVLEPAAVAQRAVRAGTKRRARLEPDRVGRGTPWRRS